MAGLLKEKPVVGIVAIAAILMLSAMILFRSDEQKNVSGDIWFYDVDAASLYPASSKTQPPTAAPSGGKGVAAIVMSCGSCNESERFIAYLQTNTDEYNRAAISGEPIAPALIMNGILVRTADDTDGKWIKSESPQGRQVIASAMKRCGSDAPKMCLPQ